MKYWLVTFRQTGGFGGTPTTPQPQTVKAASFTWGEWSLEFRDEQAKVVAAFNSGSVFSILQANERPN